MLGGCATSGRPLSAYEQQQQGQALLGFLGLAASAYDARTVYQNNQQIRAYNSAVIQQNQAAIQQEQARGRILTAFANQGERK